MSERIRSAAPTGSDGRGDTGAVASESGQRSHVPRHLGLALVVIATAQLMIVLDATIVNVALPHIQRALGFSGTGLEWIVTAYSLAFGSLLLLGGRLGDIFGRRRIFITGIALFSAGSLFGGFATEQWWLLIARAVQGAGGALAAPTALALIATTFPMGRERNRALGVWAGMAGAGGAIGLLLGGILTTYISWRWVFFVNLPIGIAVLALAPFALIATERRRISLDIPGVITSAAGLALLVYGLTHAAAGSDGVSHWGEPLTIACLSAAAVLLAAFVLIELRSSHPEVPPRLLRSRQRSGAYLIMLLLGMALFGVQFFLTIYVQTVWGYSAVKTGLAWLPMTVTLISVNIIVARFVVGKIGVRPLLLTGPLLVAVGLLWLSRLSPTGSYWGHLFFPIIVLAVGMGLMFVPLTMTVISHVRDEDSGSASSLLNVGQMVGGSIGLAALGTIAWTSVANSVKAQLAALAAAAGGTGSAAAAGAVSGGAQSLPYAIMANALTTGFSQGLRVAAAVPLAAFVVALISTWPARPRVSSAAHDGSEAASSEAPGTCEPVGEGADV